MPARLFSGRPSGSRGPPPPQVWFVRLGLCDYGYFAFQFSVSRLFGGLECTIPEKRGVSRLNTWVSRLGRAGKPTYLAPPAGPPHILVATLVSTSRISLKVTYTQFVGHRGQQRRQRDKGSGYLGGVLGRAAVPTHSPRLADDAQKWLNASLWVARFSLFNCKSAMSFEVQNTGCRAWHTYLGSRGSAELPFPLIAPAQLRTCRNGSPLRYGYFAFPVSIERQWHFSKSRIPETVHDALTLGCRAQPSCHSR